MLAGLRIIAVGATALAVAGCATQADLADLRREQRTMQRQLADTRASLDSVQRDVAATRGKVQESRYAERAQSRVENLEARVAALEQARGVTSETGTSPEAAPPPPPPPVAAVPPPEQPRVVQPRGEQPRGEVAPAEDSDATPEAYRRGVSLVRQKEYDRAIQQFREFLRTNADSPLAGNAHYWIGECYYTLGDYSQAILQYNEVRQHYAKTDRAAPSLLKIGLAFLQMGNKSEARLAFQKVVNDYPASPEAGQAKEKLKSLGA